MSKKRKPNRYKPDLVKTDAVKPDAGFGIDFCLKCILTVAVISLISLASIFIHDFLTQSDYFNVREISISGIQQATEDEIISLANLKKGENIFELNLFAIEKKIVSHPWVKSARIKRDLPDKLVISIIEQQALAIVKIENLADILINVHGHPFKEYNPEKDRVQDLPVISGLDLTAENDEYLFKGPLFNAVMDLLNTRGLSHARQIKADKNTGIAIIFNHGARTADKAQTRQLEIKLGFSDFHSKLKRANQIKQFMAEHFPERAIDTMDICRIHKIFVKTKDINALHNTLEKGV